MKILVISTFTPIAYLSLCCDRRASNVVLRHCDSPKLATRRLVREGASVYQVPNSRNFVSVVNTAKIVLRFRPAACRFVVGMQQFRDTVSRRKRPENSFYIQGRSLFATSYFEGLLISSSTVLSPVTYAIIVLVQHVPVLVKSVGAANQLARILPEACLNYVQKVTSLFLQSYDGGVAHYTKVPPFLGG